MQVRIHPHALERMAERGVSRDEIVATMEKGERFPAKFGRIGFRRNFTFDGERNGKYYRTKQIELFAVEEENDRLVITVITRYF